MANKMTISWENSLPSSGLKPNSIYIINPNSGNKPLVYVTNKTGTNAYQVNPDVDTSTFIKKVNNLTPNSNGEVTLNAEFNTSTGKLKITGSSVEVDFDARYVKLSDYTPWKNTVDTKLASLESTVTEGLKTPVQFNAATTTVFPTQTKGFTYKVTVAGTVAGIELEVGDTLIYDGNNNTPYVVQSNLSDATMTVKGVIAIANQTEVNAGTVANKVVVPSTLAARLTSFLTGITASQAEVNDGTVTNKFVTPATLASRLNTFQSSIHTHSNKTVLDKFSESGTGELQYNGDGVYTIGNSAW